MPSYRNEIVQGNCVDVMHDLPAGLADLIFADPPYNLQINEGLTRADGSAVKGVHDTWDKFKDADEYEKFTAEWLAAARHALKPNGSLFVMGSYHNIYRVGAILQQTGWWFINDILWIKANPTPNFLGTRLCNAHETILWVTKSEKAKFTFHYQLMKQENNGKQLRSDWYFPICQGKERLKNDDGTLAHNTQKPLALVERIVKMASNEGDLILDPFFGSGTTGVAAKKLGRDYLGIELEQRYCDVAAKRIQEMDANGAS